MRTANFTLALVYSRRSWVCRPFRQIQAAQPSHCACSLASVQIPDEILSWRPAPCCRSVLVSWRRFLRACSPALYEVLMHNLARLPLSYPVGLGGAGTLDVGALMRTPLGCFSMCSSQDAPASKATQIPALSRICMADSPGRGWYLEAMAHSICSRTPLSNDFSWITQVAQTETAPSDRARFVKRIAPEGC